MPPITVSSDVSLQNEAHRKCVRNVLLSFNGFDTPRVNKFCCLFQTEIGNENGSGFAVEQCCPL